MSFSENKSETSISFTQKQLLIQREASHLRNNVYLFFFSMFNGFIIRCRYGGHPHSRKRDGHRRLVPTV